MSDQTIANARWNLEDSLKAAELSLRIAKRVLESGETSIADFQGQLLGVLEQTVDLVSLLPNESLVRAGHGPDVARKAIALAQKLEEEFFS